MEDLNMKASTLSLAEQGWRCKEGCEKRMMQERSTMAWSLKQ